MAVAPELVDGRFPRAGILVVIVEYVSHSRWLSPRERRILDAFESSSALTWKSASELNHLLSETWSLSSLESNLREMQALGLVEESGNEWRVR